MAHLGTLLGYRSYLLYTKYQRRKLDSASDSCCYASYLLCAIVRLSLIILHTCGLIVTIGTLRVLCYVKQSVSCTTAYLVVRCK